MSGKQVKRLHSHYLLSSACLAARILLPELRLLSLPLHPHAWKNCLPQNLSLVPKSLGTAALEYPKKNNPVTLCQARPILGCSQSSLSHLKIPSFGKSRRLQHDHPCVLKEEKESQFLPSFCLNLAQNSHEHHRCSACQPLPS